MKQKYDELRKRLQNAAKATEISNPLGSRRLVYPYLLLIEADEAIGKLLTHIASSRKPLEESKSVTRLFFSDDDIF